MRRLLSFLGLLVCASAVPSAEPLSVGVARVDITPTYPVRLSGFGGRRTESEGVTQKIWAKALALGETDPAVVITIDNLGVSTAMTDEVAARLRGQGVRPERLVLSCSHTHTAPMLRGVCATLFGMPIPEEHQKNIERYSKEFVDRLEQVALAALKDRQPAQLSWGIGTVGFARNRRTRGGPVDHDLPLLVIRTPQGKIRALYTSYACHCVTLSNNKVSGDWAGFAQQALEDDHPGAIALVSVGCGADSNPDSGVTGDKAEIAQRQGMQVAAEVKRLLAGPLTPLTVLPTAATRTVSLPLAPLPTRAEWQERAKRADAIGHHARTQLARLDRGEMLRTAIDYRVTVWTFGDALAMLFLPGEVVVDYSLLVKRQHHGHRLWINAYCNDSPGYVPSERVLKEGGYEGGGAMVYYDIPGPYQTGLQATITKAIDDLLGTRFPPLVDPWKTGASLPPGPRQAQGALVPRRGWTVDLVAAEPLIGSPVAIDFGPDGRLWVAEMYDYPSGIDGKFGPGGRVRVLEDTDGDGFYDKSTVFLEGIPFPTGITVWRKGVLVCAAPDILYAEDRQRNGKADLVQKLYSGFGTENYQARVNSLCYGLDGWVYGSCGLFGGRITSHKTGQVLSLGDRDFRIRPETGEIEPATGRTQQGRVRDDWDNTFGCDNSDFARHYPLPDHSLRRNPHLAVPAISRHVPEGPEADRVIPARSQLQLFKSSGPPGRATAACGLGVYRDDLVGRDYSGNLFICEPVNLLVHRLSLAPQESTFVGRRPSEESDSEFLASTDNWFRPVQMRTGPDGAIWIVDMARSVIEHPRFIPAEDLARVDVRGGSRLGRIYRVYPSGTALRAVPRLDRLDPVGRVAALDTANGTVRDLAMQMLLWANDTSAIPGLEKLARDATRPEVRMQALCTLEGLGGLSAPAVQRAIRDRHPGVRRHAVRLGEGMLAKAPQLAEQMIEMLDDGDAQVRLQLAQTLGSWRDPRAGLNLAALLLKQGQDSFLTTAVLSSIHAGNVSEVLVGILGTEKPAAETAMQRLLAVAPALADRPTLQRTIHRLSHPVEGNYSGWQMAAFSGLVEALDRRGQSLESLLDESTRRGVKQLFAQARALAADEKAELPLRLAAVPLLGRGLQAEDEVAFLGGLLVPQQPDAIQGSALASLARMRSSKAAEILVAGWNHHSPSLKAQILDTLLGREIWHGTLLSALEKGTVPPGQVDAARRQRLLSHKDPKVRSRAEGLFSRATGDRALVIKTYAPVAERKGDASRGRTVFGKVCAACHRLDNAGVPVGPDLSALANKSPQYLIQEIFDPNRNIDTRYIEYRVETKSGRVFTGILAAETSTSLTLKGQEGKQQTLLRGEIDSLTSTGRSLMPEGLEKDLAPEALADLLAYLMQQAPPPKTFPENTPGLVKPTGASLVLRATQAAVHGGDIAFETPFNNIGMWHGINDHAVWTLEIAKTGAYDVWLDWSCAEASAGNTYALSVGAASLRGRVNATGGWDRYVQAKVGTLTLREGQHSLTVRPEGALKGALMDLRTVYLVPASTTPIFAPQEKPLPSDIAALARIILDDREATVRRQSAVNASPERASELVLALAAGLQPGDTKEEYRRIPWIWRVAVAAGKRNEEVPLRRLLASSLPRQKEPLRDWQAVVIGGGIINGISLAGPWPLPRIRELLGKDAELQTRWAWSLAEAARMADNPKVAMGTRYDALRMVALDRWEICGPQLKRYLAKETNAELQQGAVSGLVDVDHPEAGQALLGALLDLTAGNRAFAVDGLLRSAARIGQVLSALEKGTLRREWLGEKHVKTLLSLDNPGLRARAEKLLGR